LADFRHVVDKRRPPTTQCSVGDEVVDHPCEHPLVALARRRFVKYDQRAARLPLAHALRC
jgi:hypothetical protein